MNEYCVSLPTPDGTFAARFTEHGLAALSFPGGSRVVPASGGVELPAPVRTWVKQLASALERLLAARPPRALPPLDLSAGTDFQRAVWQALREIPMGETRTYARIAAALQRPQAARAVGQACGANPIPVLVPCHRVVAAGGGLGGFSGGLDWKRRLLARERAVL